MSGIDKGSPLLRVIGHFLPVLQIFFGVRLLKVRLPVCVVLHINALQEADTLQTSGSHL